MTNLSEIALIMFTGEKIVPGGCLGEIWKLKKIWDPNIDARLGYQNFGQQLFVMPPWNQVGQVWDKLGQFWAEGNNPTKMPSYYKNRRFRYLYGHQCFTLLLGCNGYIWGDATVNQVITHRPNLTARYSLPFVNYQKNNVFLKRSMRLGFFNFSKMVLQGHVQQDLCNSVRWAQRNFIVFFDRLYGLFFAIVLCLPNNCF